MSISASIKSKKVVFIAAIVAFVGINAAVVIHVYRKNTAPPVIADDEGDYEDSAPGGAPVGAPAGGGGAPAVVKAAPGKMQPDGNEDGVYRDAAHVNIYSGHGIMSFDIKSGNSAFRYRELDIKPLDKVDMTIMRYGEPTFKAMRDAGVTEEQIKKFRAVGAFPAMYPAPAMDKCKALLAAYEKAEGADKQTALDALNKALKETGDVFTASYASLFAGRKSAMTAEQYTAFRANIQKGFDDADRIAAEKREADKAAAATRPAAAAATRAAVAPPPVPVDPNKPRPLPYPPPPWEVQGEGVHIP